MRKQRLVVGTAMFALIALAVAAVSAQTPANPRYGHWKLKSDAAPPSSNIMSYEPFNGAGMKITIDSVNKDGAKSQWWYTTMFDGKDESLTGNPGTDTGAVKIVNARINQITYKKGGKVTQMLINTLSPDGNTIDVSYIRLDADGKVTGVTFATYEKMK